MMLRGLRGATTANENTEEAILRATRELLTTMIETNGVRENEVASILFSSTSDLTAAFPARAARDLGWEKVAFMGTQEMDVPHGLDRCIRVLIHWNTVKGITGLQHIYLHGAKVLRPDWADGK
ncbi:MAG: chorismate mutase [Anaerolineaceae bacterium]|nr:chorismate mutase [Anaerolineaceae bacterium]